MLKRIMTTSSLTLISLITAIALAESSSGGFEITKSTVDNGGGTSSGGDFSLTGTIGQHEANSRVSSGGDFLLAGGFWAKAHDVIFKNSFESN